MAISIFMQIESETTGTIEGSCDVTGREGWMECIEMSHHVYSPTDKVTGMITGNRVHEPFRVAKMVDKATPYIYKHLCTGANLTEVLLHFYEIDSAGKEVEYFTVKLENARIISVQPVMFNTRTPEYERMPHLETIQFGYEQITWTEARDNIEHMDNYRNDNA